MGLFTLEWRTRQARSGSRTANSSRKGTVRRIRESGSGAMASGRLATVQRGLA